MACLFAELFPLRYNVPRRLISHCAIPGEERQMKRFQSIKFKIIAATLLCVTAVAFASSTALYYYANQAISEKSDRIQQMYLTTMQSQMEEYIADAVSLLLLCSNDNTISSALNSSSSSSKVRLMHLHN